MSSTFRRLRPVILILPIVVVGFALIYSLGMTHLEGRPRDFWSSLEWASETLTSTGYGADAEWHHPAMVLLVIFAQFLGVSMVFFVLPLYLVPVLEDTLSGRMPRKIPKLRNYVLIYRWGPAVATLLDSLQAAKVPAVVFEEDEATTRRLVDRGVRVVYGRLEDGDPEPEVIKRSRVIVANGTDHDNGAVIIAARQFGFKGEILALARDPFHRHPMTRAGANVVFTPQHILAAALAARASERITPRVAGIRQLSSHLDVAELRIHRESTLAGKTLAEVNLRRTTGATIIGFWQGGEFSAQPQASDRLVAGTIIVAIGSPERLKKLADLARPLPSKGPIVVVGYGEVGRKVVELLHDAGEETRVINRDEGEGVDFVGDALDHAVLEKAGIVEARAVIVALSSDSATLFAISIIRGLSPEAVLIARVNRGENVNRIHGAGADFALSLSHVAGQMLSHHLLKESAVAIETRIKVVKLKAGSLAGHSPTGARVQRRTGCSIVAIERGEETVLEFDDAFSIQPDDTIYVCGPTQGIARYRRTFLKNAK